MHVRVFAGELLAGSVVLTAAVVLLSHSGNSKTPLPPPPVTSAAAPHLKTYTTTFPRDESPIAEGGRWIAGKSAGMDWGDVLTSHGDAFGVAGPKPFADSVALLIGAWGPDQTAEAVVQAQHTYRAPEVSLRLRSSLTPHRCTGYEISEAVRTVDSDDAYLIIVRWNGPLADFTYLLHATGRHYGVKTGDVVRATIAGNVISAWKNGVLIGQAQDVTFPSGQPGFGFNEGRNGHYSISRFTVSARDSSL